MTISRNRTGWIFQRLAFLYLPMTMIASDLSFSLTSGMQSVPISRCAHLALCLSLTVPISHCAYLSVSLSPRVSQTQAISLFLSLYLSLYLSVSHTASLSGMGDLLARFLDILEEFRRKQYGLLDVSMSQFDQDDLEFFVTIHDLQKAENHHMKLSFQQELKAAFDKQDSVPPPPPQDLLIRK